MPVVSIVVPLFDEEGNVRALVEEVRAAMEVMPSWELLLVDDGSRDGTARLAETLSLEDPRVRCLRLARNYGQSTAMQAGFDQARAPVVVTMDGDLQNDPRDIPALVEALNGGYDLVVGYRVRRKDRFFRRKVPSWVANRIIGWVTGVPVRDNGCTLKAYRHALLERLRIYSDFHRFIPAVAAGTAGARIAEIPVDHRPRHAGKSKYGLSRILRVMADLMTITMIRSFRDRPLHLFSLLAAGSASVGAAFAAATVIAGGFRAFKAEALVLPSAALLWFSLATFLVLLGLVGEAIIHRSPESHFRSLVRELG